MSFIDHLEVLRGHLFRAVVAVAIGAVIAGIYNKFIIKNILLGPTFNDFPTYGVICRLGKSLNLGDALCMEGILLKLQSTTVSGQFSMWFTVVLVSGLILAFPYVFYQFWSFIKPALTRKELSRTRGVIFWVSFLFFTGVLFGYFVIAPYALNFFFHFQLEGKAAAPNAAMVREEEFAEGGDDKGARRAPAKKAAGKKSDEAAAE